MPKNDKPSARTRKSATRRASRSASEARGITSRERPAHQDPSGAEESSAGGRGCDFPIVGLGASAGGLAAFEAFFSALPREDVGMAFVLVQHLAPDHKSLLHEIVGRYTRMQVSEVKDGMEVKPDCAYIIPPNKDMSLREGKLRLSAPAPMRTGLRLPIDFFFRSLAREQGERAICVVLSGTGSDGTLGLRAIKGENGMAMAQTPESADHGGMPRSAINTGLVDYVLPPNEMPAQLIAYARHAFGRPERRTVAQPNVEDALKKLCVLLRSQTGHDFSQYKETTLLRRIQRRMALHQIEDLEQYLHYVRANIAETEALFRDLLIGVTSFFRDADAYQALEKTALPQLFASKSPDDTIRVWVCGCSTGEEAYSIAILLQEQMDANRRAVRVQVFATDIDREALEIARAGTYPASIVSDVGAERLARYFTFDQENGVYRVQKTIRDLLIFSEQDVARDPPFSRLDIVSCRNLLIYMKRDLQERLMHLFHYALRPGGVLFLGTSESVGDMTGEFAALDRKWKLYQRLAQDAAPVRPVLGELVVPSHATDRRERSARMRFGQHRVDLKALTEQALLHHYAHAGVLTDLRGEVLHIFGRTGKFLEPASGDAAMNIISMAREGLQRPLSSAIHKVALNKGPVRESGLQVRANGGFIGARLTVRPVMSGDGAPTQCVLVVLEEEETKPPTPFADAAADAPAVGRVASLEQELRAKEEYLQTTLEEMETTNEELKSTNEEMQSVNEELQSTNEELETSKEELQSVNEELATVNAELQDKVADLSRANNDMNNLLAGTGVGTLFVDNHLRISRFTPATTQVINLIQHDVGRPIGHVVNNLVGYDALATDAQAVLESLTPRESEVQANSGAWYLMRIRPYRTIENVIEGVVITFFDVSERKRAELSLRRSEARFEAICRQAFAGIAQFDATGHLLFANEQYCDMLRYTRPELEKLTLADITHSEDWAANQAHFARLMEGGPDFSMRRRLRRKDGTTVWVNERFNGVRNPAGSVDSIVSITIAAEKVDEREPGT